MSDLIVLCRNIIVTKHLLALHFIYPPFSFSLFCCIKLSLSVISPIYFLAEGRELVRLLLAAGADPSAQDTQHGRTALHTAAMANDVELVKVC